MLGKSRSLRREMSLLSDKKLRLLVETFVREQVAIGIYDPNNPKRPKVPIIRFTIEFLESDEESQIIHAAGPVDLAAAQGSITQHLRISIPYRKQGKAVALELDGIIATYIVETDPETGACKETAALANA
jgi:hypothetical protein